MTGGGCQSGSGPTANLGANSNLGPGRWPLPPLPARGSGRAAFKSGHSREEHHSWYFRLSRYSASKASQVRACGFRGPGVASQRRTVVSVTWIRSANSATEQPDCSRKSATIAPVGTNPAASSVRSAGVGRRGAAVGAGGRYVSVFLIWRDTAGLSDLLRNLDIAAVPHGFRSSFRDWAAEDTDHPREVIEAALAHVVRNPVEAAYARSDLFERRRRLMNDWEAYLAATHP